MFRNVSCSWFYRRAVTSVLCKLTFSKRVGCRVTSNRWDFVWEIKYILSSANAKYRYSYLFFCKTNKGDLLLMYSCIHRFSPFFGCYCLTSVTFFIRFHKRLPWVPEAFHATCRPSAGWSSSSPSSKNLWYPAGNQIDAIKILVQRTSACVTLRKLQFRKLTLKNSLNLHTQCLGDQWLQFILAPSFLCEE